MMATTPSYPVVIRDLPPRFESKSDVIKLINEVFHDYETQRNSNGDLSNLPKYQVKVNGIYFPVPANLLQVDWTTKWRGRHIVKNGFDTHDGESGPSETQHTFKADPARGDALIDFHCKSDQIRFGHQCEKEGFIVDQPFSIADQVQLHINPRMADVIRKHMEELFSFLRDRSGVHIVDDNGSMIMTGKEWQVTLATNLLHRLIRVACDESDRVLVSDAGNHLVDDVDDDQSSDNQSSDRNREIASGETRFTRRVDSIDTLVDCIMTQAKTKVHHDGEDDKGFLTALYELHDEDGNSDSHIYGLPDDSHISVMHDDHKSQGSSVAMNDMQSLPGEEYSLLKDCDDIEKLGSSLTEKIEESVPTINSTVMCFEQIDQDDQDETVRSDTNLTDCDGDTLLNSNDTLCSEANPEPVIRKSPSPTYSLDPSIVVLESITESKMSLGQADFSFLPNPGTVPNDLVHSQYSKPYQSSPTEQSATPSSSGMCKIPKGSDLADNSLMSIAGSSIVVLDRPNTNEHVTSEFCEVEQADDDDTPKGRSSVLRDSINSQGTPEQGIDMVPEICVTRNKTDINQVSSDSKPAEQKKDLHSDKVSNMEEELELEQIHQSAVVVKTPERSESADISAAALSPSVEASKQTSIDDSSKTMAMEPQQISFINTMSINRGFWLYILKNEKYFETTLKRICSDNTSNVILGDTDTLTIHASGRDALNRLKIYIRSVYDGFEFILHEAVIPCDPMSMAERCEMVNNINPSVVVLEDPPDGIRVIGQQQEIDTLLESLNNSRVVPEESSPSTPTDVPPQESVHTESIPMSPDPTISDQKRDNSASALNPDGDRASPVNLVNSHSINLDTDVFHFMQMFRREELEAIQLNATLHSAKDDNGETVSMWSASSDMNSANECVDNLKLLVSSLRQTLCTEIVKINQDKTEALQSELPDVPFILMPSDCDYEVTIEKINIPLLEKALLNVQNNQQMNSSQGNRNQRTLPAGFLLGSQTKIIIHKCDITQLQVDAIVNAANEDLKHHGGLAKLIADAAGPEFVHEGEALVRRRGKLPVGAVEFTGAGNLLCGKVFHAVGPRWPLIQKNQGQCLEVLKTTFKNILDKATQLSIDTLAIPAVSAGIFGVPSVHVADTMCQAILESAGRNQMFEEIHIVDISNNFLQIVCEKLSIHCNLITGVRTFVQVLPKTHVDQLIAMRKLTLPCGFLIGGKTQVFIHQCDITKIEVDAIVSSTNPQLSNNKGVARTIAAAGGPDLQKQCDLYAKKRKLFPGDIVQTVGGKLRAAVIHAVAPIWPRFWSISKKKGQTECLDQLSRTVNNIIAVAKNASISTVAVPSICAGASHVPKDLVAEIICSTLVTELQGATQLEQVHLVDIQSDILKYYTKQFATVGPGFAIPLDREVVDWTLSQCLLPST